MKKLPIGISGLEKIVTDNYLYVDKTRHIYNLVNGGGYYFLSRPRRFGKSLLIDTLKQAFSGKRELFSGLFLEHNWDWDVQYPVLHFTFAEGDLATPEALNNKIHSFLNKYYQQYQLENIYEDVSSSFSFLIESLALSHNKVVILIDEYDKPILDNITDSNIAAQMRRGLRNFYSVIKAQDSNLKFVILTGVSKFSKISLFSELNNLEDITLDARYADICGYNQAELESSFQEYLEYGKVDRVLLRKWYNGYNFAGAVEQKVYNPFDILLFINKGYRYQNYWFETATPTFLVRMFEKNNYFIPDLEDILITDKQLSTFDVDNMPLTNLLFQTGYLTIKEITTIGTQFAYRLTYPNLEVKASLNDSLLEIGGIIEVKNSNVAKLSQVLLDNNFERLQIIFTSHFASIPHDWYRNNHIDNYEGFYASVIYSYFAALGYDLIAEDITNQGKIDLTVIMPDKILIIEFKLSKYGTAEDAIQQIISNNYPQKYQAENKPIYLLGMSFDNVARNLADIKVSKTAF
jgi:hypothetical protein